MLVSVSRRQRIGAAGALALPSLAAARQSQSLLNVSHGGSSRQARSVADGLEADVITMNQHNDIDILHTRGGLVPANGATRLPNNASPTTSITVILVRKGNPKNIRDWSDLGRAGLQVIIPNPKTSGNGRYTYLAAWGAGVKGGATTTFAQRKLGDALVTFESEAPLITREFGDGFELVYPSRTILAKNPVSVVDRVVDRRGTRRLAEAYLQHLYTPEGQEIAAKHHLRPRNAQVLARHAKQFPKVSPFTVDEVFGGWTKAQTEHFNDGGHHDQVILAAKGR